MEGSDVEVVLLSAESVHPVCFSVAHGSYCFSGSHSMFNLDTARVQKQLVLGRLREWILSGAPLILLLRGRKAQRLARFPGGSNHRVGF